MGKNRIFRFIIAFIIFFSFLTIPLGSYLLFTKRGSSFLVKLVISRYVEPKQIAVDKIQGNLAKGLIFSEVEVGGLKGLPKGTVFKVQQVRVSFRPFKFDTLNLEIENGRLVLPYSEPIVLFANYKKVKLDVNVYSRKIDAKEIINLFTKEEAAKDISGAITNVDSYVKGSFRSPELMGVFEVEELKYKALSLFNCPGSFAISLNSNKTGSTTFQGAIVFEKGIVKSQNTTVKIKESKIIFPPGSNYPVFDFQGSSNIDGTNIQVELLGTIARPDLRLASDSPRLPPTLLFMLITGSRKEDQQISYRGQITQELARDFLHYFLLGQSSYKEKIAKDLGVVGVP